MSTSDIPKRLICCVDGTYCTPDGPKGVGYGNITNTYRIFASVKEGRCFDEVTQQEYIQEKIYEEGIGSADDMGALEKAIAGIRGEGFKNIIKKVYRRCCLLDDKDEVWLYGFSRGAYIVRAVAGLLYYIWALRSAESAEFDAEYSRALRIYEDADRRERCGPGQLDGWIRSKAKRPPRIQFIGVFDTVKALNDKNLHDISFNDSTQHFRHALALNEDRKAMEPEYAFTKFVEERTKLVRRSIVQAWFVGAHIDMGGSARNDGLSLYPLQWILGESEAKGLKLEFTKLVHPRAIIDDPLRVIRPRNEDEGKGCDPWNCTTSNGMKIHVQDLRNVHELDVYNQRYSIKINSRKGFYWDRQDREPFGRNGWLKGHCAFAPQGTIIHPSVYQYLDENLMCSWGHNALRDRETLEKWRPKMLGEDGSILNQGFWAKRRTTTAIDGLKSIRILVVGNTGAGKSTLINRVFGVKESDELRGAMISARAPGQHNVEDEIRYEGRRDLIIHDSGGFEAGDESQMQAVAKFVKDKSSRIRIEDRLHVIWFCIEMSSDRTQQTATVNLFKAVSSYAAEVPLIIVATKKDRFEAIQRWEAEQIFQQSIDDELELLRKCKVYAAGQTLERLDLIEGEMRNIDKGHFDACVSVAKDDMASIKRLSDVTLQNVKYENLRLLYVAAQVAEIDLKINLAIIETMSVYRRVLGTTSILGFVPTAALGDFTVSAISISKAIVHCFGLPTMSHYTIYEIVKTSIWDDLGHYVSITIAQAFIPLPLAVLATTRLMLLLASDIILILVRAFKETTYTFVGQPTEKDVENAARFYRPMSAKVHREVLKLVPKRNVTKSYRHNDVRLGLEKIVHGFKNEVTSDINSGRQAGSNSSDSDRTAVEEEMNDLVTDIKTAEAEMRDPETIARSGLAGLSVGGRE